MMRRNRRVPRITLEVQPLEGRILLSGLMLPRMGESAVLAGLLQPSSITTDPGGIAAILTALHGGAGSEFVKLIHKEMHNQAAVLAGFISGRLNSYAVPGVAVTTPSVQPLFTGHFYDQLGPTVAGAVLLRGNALEFAAIMRGPFHDPGTSYYIFALNRGSGQRLGPMFPSHPGITPDALVTLSIGPYGSNPTGTISDLVNGSSQGIDPSQIRVDGSVVRVYLHSNQFASTGFSVPKYRFAFWTQTQLGGDISTVVNFLPSNSMIPIGVLKNVSPTH